MISPSNRAADMRRKIGNYFEAGTREVGVVYPPTPSVELHRPDGTIRALGADREITSDVLPGFRLPVSEIFRFG